jgi:hypothetical protein
VGEVTARRKPVTTARTYGKGSAAKQDALRKGKVAASKAKLDALIARQAEAEAPSFPHYCTGCGAIYRSLVEKPAPSRRLCQACRRAEGAPPPLLCVECGSAPRYDVFDYCLACTEWYIEHEGGGA